MRRETSIIIVAMLLSSLLALSFDVQQVRAIETIYIRADGSIYPPTASIVTADNATYWFTNNMTDHLIIVEKDNITIDGAGYTLQGPGGGHGIDLTGRNNLTIRNMEVNNYLIGIYLDGSCYNKIEQITSIEGYPVSIGMEDHSNYNVVTDCTLNSGRISIWNSSYNVITENQLVTPVHIMHYSTFNRILRNNISSAVWVFDYSSNNTIAENRIDGYVDSWAISISDYSHGNFLLGNQILNSEGIRLVHSSYNIIVGNTIGNNSLDLYLFVSHDNLLFHNNFVNNTQDVDSFPVNENLWDNGCEGNYWSNYTDSDLNGDGIGDTPYIIDEYNIDHYPLMNPFWNLGDLDHDLDVDIFDIVKAATIYGSTSVDPNWDPHCDIAEPYGIIDIFDIVVIASQYGEEYIP